MALSLPELDNEVGERIRQIGGEFGATTGRARRTGWIDLPALKYGVMINGVTQIAMTKADVLNDFETIEACTAYEYNGQRSEQIPYDLCNTAITPIYQQVKGWNTDLRKFNNYGELPKEFMDYLQFVEERLGVPVSMISTGPERERLVFKDVLASV